MLGHTLRRRRTDDTRADRTAPTRTASTGRRFLGAALLAGLTALVGAGSLAGCQSTDEVTATDGDEATGELDAGGDRDDGSTMPGEPDLTHAELRRLMRGKLDHAEALLSGLAVADWDSLRENADALRRISLRSEWEVHGTVAYSVFSTRFREALTDLAGHARERSLQKVTRDYTRMTDTCIDCHDYIRREGLTLDMPGSLTWIERADPLLPGLGWSIDAGG